MGQMNKNILPYLSLLLALGANTLIVELVIPRMIAPVFGNTLFCWTERHECQAYTVDSYALLIKCPNQKLNRSEFPTV